MDREPTATTALSRCPVRMIILIMYQISRHSITAEASESLTKAQISLKAADENPTQPSLQEHIT